jgi:uncharacterized membrane protein YhfC
MMSTVSLSPIALLGGTGMILVALGFFTYAALRRLGWGYLALGALAWVVTVAIKFAWALPLNSRIYSALTGGLPGGIGAGLFDLYVGLLTGFTEVAIVWLVMRYTRLGKTTWERALAFGIGFGAIEAFLLGLGSLASALVAILAPQMIPPEAMTQLAVMNNVLYGIAPIVERFFTIWVHIFCNVLIFFAAAKTQTRWFWIAFWFKSLIDAVAGFAQTSGVIATTEGIWAIEAVVVLWGILGWLGVRWLEKRYGAALQDASPNRFKVSEIVTVGILGLSFVALTTGAVLTFLPQSKNLIGGDRDAVLAYSESKTTSLLTAINNNDYAVFSRDLNDKMKNAISADGLVNIRTKVNGKIGNYASRQVDSVVQSGDFVTVIYLARYENEERVTMRVSFEVAEPHRISGLWFDSEKLR